MNDFSELEKELRKLRPARPSPVLFRRVGAALENYRAGRFACRSTGTVALQLVVVRLRPCRCCNFGCFRSNQFPIDARATRRNRGEFGSATRNKNAPARNRSIHVARQICFCRWRARRIQRARRRAAILLTVLSDPYGASGTGRSKPGGGVTRRRVHRFACRIPARKSC